MKKVLVFGTFDIIHPGHVYFLTQAKSYGDYLVVVVGRDQTVKGVKGRCPHNPQERRVKNLLRLGIAEEVRLGNPGADKYKVIEEVQPDVICLGYDQAAFTDRLSDELKKRGLNTEIVRIDSHIPEKYKSSKLREYLPRKEDNC